jgi:superfamily II DNA or RNA helicase/HKD family nuclease
VRLVTRLVTSNGLHSLVQSSLTRVNAASWQAVRPGPRDHLITQGIAALLAGIDPEMIDRGPLDAAEGPARLSRHLSAVIERALHAIGDDPQLQAALVNELISARAESDDREAEVVELPPEVWYGVREAAALFGEKPRVIPAPSVPLSISDLLANAEGQPNIGSELRLELESADGVDLLCAFVIWSGVVRLRDALAGVVQRGGQVRVITTTYMGATQRRAVDELVRIGAQVRVAFDARMTKLHAKAWLLERESGLSTAFIGSSNLSHTALFDGLEWNVRLSTIDAPYVIERVRSMFESYWASEHFEPYNPAVDAERLDRSLGAHRDRDADASVSFIGLEVHPYPHQQRMLERLMVERERHGRHRNLVVAATGTGKTVVAALDYRQLRRRAGRDLSLLFVAHRERILEQSRGTFRHVVHDGSFGQIHGGGRVAAGRHVFAMIQSVSEEDIARLRPQDFDVVIVDEFHHAAAPSYRRLLDRLDPDELLGLTATPERMDAQDVTEYFDGRIAVELRLWEAIDEGFLVPFEYFGVADGTDLTNLRWQRGGYARDELDRVITGDDARVGKLLEAIRRVIADPGQMRALGFCVSVEHANYMARRFTAAGLDSVSLSGQTPEADRAAALRRLEVGELRAVFSVDVLGEGVDVPHVDTVLLLRPTDSATVFTQQLGRGLRRADGKPYLTVIDLIGQQHRQFRFDRRLAALVDRRRGPLERQIEYGFPFLPSGCHIELDRQSEEIVLANLRDAARLTQWRTLVDDLRAMPRVSLTAFLEETDRAPVDVYRRPDYSWTRLRRDARRRLAATGPVEEERDLLRALRRMLHIDDPERVHVYRALLASSSPPRHADADERQRRLLLMLHYDLWGTRRTFPDLDTSLRTVWRHAPVREELHELLGVLDERSTALTRPSTLAPEIPLHVHASYSRDEILGAYAEGSPMRPPQLREGVRHVASAATDLLLITLKKAERDYSPTTLYRDYAIAPDRFHWESQSTQSAGSPTIERYEQHASRNHTIVVFVRERKTLETGVGSPYVCLGPVRYVASSGSRPVSFTWALETPMPEELFASARAVAVA